MAQWEVLEEINGAGHILLRCIVQVYDEEAPREYQQEVFGLATDAKKQEYVDTMEAELNAAPHRSPETGLLCDNPDHHQGATE